PLPFASAAPAEAATLPFAQVIAAGKDWKQDFQLAEGAVVAVSVHLPRPSALSANGKLRVSWEADQPGDSWTKVLHAFDPDAYVVYKAPRSGRYALRLTPVTEEAVPANV